ncbi:hypothetical protein JFB93_06205 [Providencia rettgeri]|uniref:hypothetical protein n=1 Tax=Providencia rettgeri TaxID=587 RepID=UPI0018E73B32|nr:hypothetical protein JFB93_06205 [Providencia rettgeri]QWJ93831.1 hypothetical protein KM147_06250 [Providencia rettgeri]
MTDKLYTYGNMPDKAGGAAFPASGHPNMQFVAQEGMSLRDYFAAKAMQGDWTNQSAEVGYFANCNEEQLVNSAKIYYRMADAMLKARG